VNDAVYPSLGGRKVLVTGGATGIGSALVERFARQGSRVAFLDIDDVAGSELAARLAGTTIIACDLRDTGALASAVSNVETALGGIDILLNNAASDDRHELEDIGPAYWDERIAINLRHQFFAAQAVVPAMRAAGGGAIVNFGSISWHLGLPNLVVYQTAKAGVEGLTRSLARELGRDNIRVTTIVPGSVQTPRQARWYTPEGEDEIVTAQCLNGRIQPADVAALALFLASADARLCTGHEYFVDAGWR
jgi:NAD(P)-dependent dehydrogenase (short-subunit alcohol dehydrogenase family)